MADETLLKIIANSPTIPQLSEGLNINADDYVVVYSASLQKAIKIKKSNIQFPTTSFIRAETQANFPLTGVLDSLYLENSTNKLYKWTGTAYKWLMEDELATINAYIATKLDKGTYTGDAVNLLAEAKAYADSLANGLKWKDPVQLATTANVALTGEQTIDGVLTSASRVLVKSNTAGAENGFYTTAAGAWVRTADADTGAELINATVKVEQGTVNANKFYTNNNTAITLGTTDVTFVSMGSVQDHNSTTGLQGGTTSEYYHLSLAHWNKVNSLPAVSEDTANKAVDFTIVSDTKYPTTKAVSDKLAEEDDVKSYVNTTGFPTTGKKGVIYIAEDTEFLYLWDEQTLAYKFAGGGGTGGGTWGSITGTLADQTDLNTALNGKEKKRTIKPLANTTQYTLIAADFTDFTLDFTANAGETISVILNAGVAPLNGQIQAISSGNNFLVPTAGTGVTIIRPEGTNLKTTSKGWFGGVVLSTDKISINGNLESNEIAVTDNELKVYKIPTGELTATPTDSNIQTLIAEWIAANATEKLDIQTIAWEIVIDTTAPSVPTGVAVSSITATSATVTWNASTDS